jgi:transcriptional regulator GlxA family with amidase domain
LPATEAAALAAPLAAAYFANADDAYLVSVARGTINQLSGAAPRAEPTDARILRAITHVRDHIEEPVTLAALARTAGLSPSRFRHLFVSQTGVSTKAFILWERLNRALELGFSGTPWTEAAHAANFADSAHLTRTCRRMFGLAPTGGRIERPDAAARLTA